MANEQPLGIDGYTNLHLIHNSATSAVYRADSSEHGTVAIKVRSGRRPLSPGVVNRLKRVPAHPGLASVLSTGFTYSGEEYVVLAYVQGDTLGEAVRSVQWYPDPVTVALAGLTLVDAVQALHDSGLVHGDIQSRNVIVTRRFRPPLPSSVALGGKIPSALEVGVVLVDLDDAIAIRPDEAISSAREIDVLAIVATLAAFASGDSYDDVSTVRGHALRHPRKRTDIYRSRIADAALSDALIEAVEAPQPSLQRLRQSLERLIDDRRSPETAMASDAAVAHRPSPREEATRDQAPALARHVPNGRALEPKLGSTHFFELVDNQRDKAIRLGAAALCLTSVFASLAVGPDIAPIVLTLAAMTALAVVIFAPTPEPPPKLKRQPRSPEVARSQARRTLALLEENGTNNLTPEERFAHAEIASQLREWAK